MKKNQATKGSGNVFKDLGYPDSEKHQAKATLVSRIANLIKKCGLTQSQATTVLGIDQHEVSALLKGRFRDFSTHRLMRFVSNLECKVEMDAGEKHRGQKTMKKNQATKGSGNVFKDLGYPDSEKYQTKATKKAAEKDMLVLFLYDLMRYHLPVGTVLKLMKDNIGNVSPISVSNVYLYRLCELMARALNSDIEATNYLREEVFRDV